jgi:DNA polymerase
MAAQVNYTVYDFTSWQHAARFCLQQQTAPEEIQWNTVDELQSDLFNEATVLKCSRDNQQSNKVPRGFIDLAKKVSCHRNNKKWHLLYEALWRIVHGERHLLQIACDPLVNQLLKMRKQVSRDCHKTTAFVRFKKYTHQEHDYYYAQFKPQHKILLLVAHFFVKRFAVMNWIIATPDGYLAWNQKDLMHSTEHITFDAVHDDAEKLWLDYYTAIFNPARIKIKAMLREMPRCYWQNMPETQLIGKLLNDAPRRVTAMLNSKPG